MENFPSLYSRVHDGLMLPYSRVTSFSFKASDWLARAGQCALVLSMYLKNNVSTCCLILCFSLWKVQPTYRLYSGPEIDKQWCYDVKRMVHPFELQAEAV